jgi:hypothetical protein
VLDARTSAGATSFDAFVLRKTRTRIIIRRMIKITIKIEFNDNPIPSSGIFSVGGDLVVGVEVFSSSPGSPGDGVGVVGEVGDGVFGWGTGDGSSWIMLSVVKLILSQ